MADKGKKKIKLSNFPSISSVLEDSRTKEIIAEWSFQFVAAETKKIAAGDAGQWLVELKPQQADGKPRQIKITGKNEILLEDVLVGEVWIGSGLQWDTLQYTPVGTP